MGEAQHANVQVRYEGSAEEVLARCLDLKDRDRDAERRASTYGAAAAIGFGLGFMTLMAALVSDTLALLALVLPLVLGALVALLLRARAKASDIEDRKLKLGAEVVQALTPELASGKPVELSLDFRAHRKLPPKTSSSGGYGQRSQAWEHPWMTLTLPLMDGSRATLTVVADVKRKTKRKRKYTKIREQRREALVVELAPPKGRRFEVTTVPRLSGPYGLTLARARVRPRAARLEWTGPSSWRIRDRMGWRVGGHDLSAPAAIGALVTSYKALAATRRQAG